MEKTGDDQRSFLEVIIHTAILTLTSILSLAGNSLICLAFYRNRRLRTITNFYVLSLVVADMTMAVFYFPFGAVASSLHKWPFTKCYCHFTSFLGASWAQISTFTLALASLNRYFCLTDIQHCLPGRKQSFRLLLYGFFHGLLLHCFLQLILFMNGLQFC